MADPVFSLKEALFAFPGVAALIAMAAAAGGHKQRQDDLERRVSNVEKLHADVGTIKTDMAVVKAGLTEAIRKLDQISQTQIIREADRVARHKAGDNRD